MSEAGPTVEGDNPRPAPGAGDLLAGTVRHGREWGQHLADEQRQGRLVGTEVRTWCASIGFGSTIEPEACDLAWSEATATD